MKKVIIIGTGGHAKVVADIVLLNNDEIVGFFDEFKPNGDFFGYPILGTTADYSKYTDCEFIVAIGDSNSRSRITSEMSNAVWYTAVHPDAIISKFDVRIGEGTMICANAVVGPCASLGKHCILNTAASVDHDSVVGDFSHVSVGAHLAGNVYVGEFVCIGIGATVKDKIGICDRAVVGAGAVVVKDILKPGTYIGVPAKLKNKGKDDENKI